MDTVRQTVGGQVNRFPFNLPGQALVLSTTTNQPSAPIVKDGLNTVYTAEVRGTSGTVTATHSIYATNDPHAAGEDDPSTNPPTRNNFSINTTNTSTTITTVNGEPLFRLDMDGDEVYAVGVTPGTTMTYVSATSATLSAAATATSPTGGTQARFQAVAPWFLAGTITLSGTKVDAGSFAMNTAYKWMKDVVSNISGTNATARCKQGT